MMIPRLKNKAVYDRLSVVTQDFARKGLDLSLSFNVPGLGEVCCKKVLRAIPDKRIACEGYVGATRVLVKIYFSKYNALRNWRRWKRSAYGYEAFHATHIHAPAILFSGYLPQYAFYVLVLEYLEDGVSLDMAINSAFDGHLQDEVVTPLIPVIAAQHEAGILQNDLHLGNFMVRGETIYSLDGDQVKYLGASLSRQRSLEHLTRFLAKLPTALGSSFEPLINAYAQCRGWDFSQDEVMRLRQGVFSTRKKNLFSFLSKALKSKDPFVRNSSRGFFSVYKRQADLNLQEIIDAFRDASSGAIRARMRYETVSFSGNDMVLWTSPAWGFLTMCPWWEATRVWRNALMLERLGLGSPCPVGLVACRTGFLRWNCAVIFRQFEGITLRDFLTSPSTSNTQKERTAGLLADAFLLLSLVGVGFRRISSEDILVSRDRVIFLGLENINRNQLIKGPDTPPELLAFLDQWQDLPEIRNMLHCQIVKKCIG